MNTHILEQYCEQYQWADLRESIQSLEADPEIRIGFLGEFSSGKSTLINGLLQSALLPTSDMVTTKCITEIRFCAENTEPRFFLREEPHTELTFDEFRNQAKKGGNSGAAMLLTHPPKGGLKPGLSLIDTPGLTSLDALDVDITFGFLPFLDGAVICIDCSGGSINQSVLNFLNKPEVRPLAEYFLFALTKADNKAPKAREIIRNNIIKILQEHVYTSCPDSVPCRVVLTEIPNTRNPKLAENSPFLQAYEKVFIARVQGMHARRRELELEKIRKEMLIRLETLKTMLPQNLPDLSIKRNELKSQIEAIERERERQKDRLETLGETLETDIRGLIQTYRTRLANADADDLPALCEAFPADMNNLLHSRLQTHFSDMPDISGLTGPMADSVKDAMAQLAEPGFIEQIADGVLLNVLPLLGGPLGMAVGKVMDAVKLLGGLVAKSLIGNVVSWITSGSRKRKLDEFLAELPANISWKVKLVVDDLYETKIFQPLEQRAESLREDINRLWLERENNMKNIEEQEQALNKAIKEIQHV